MTPEAPLKPDYLAHIESVQPGHFRVVWSRVLPYRAYLIDKGDVDVVSKAIRAQLRALVHNALERDKANTRADDAAVAVAVAAEREIMQALAARCQELFSVLFTAAAGSDAPQAYVSRIRDQICAERSPKSICFLVKSRVYVPWGLLCDRLPPADADSANPADYDGFWCLRHQVSTVFDALASPHDFVVSYDSDAFRVLAAGDAREFATAKRALKRVAAARAEATVERQALAKLIKHFGRPATSSSALVDAWSGNEKSLGLLYLFCHADARTLGFSITDTMDVIKFKSKLTKSEPTPRCLVFLNGCYTANADESGTFLEATGREGFCGYIGSETEVPALFAFRFGLAFQRLLYSGLEVVEVMRTLRVRHWPLSLVYGLYAFPHLRVEPHPGLSQVAWPDINYSNGPLGESVI